MKTLEVVASIAKEDGTDMTEKLKNFIVDRFTNVVDANDCLALMTVSIIDEGVPIDTDLKLVKGEN